MATARKTAATKLPAPDAASDTVQPDIGTYIVRDTLHHDGQLYAAGMLIDLTPAQVAALPAGVIAPAEAEPAKD